MIPAETEKDEMAEPSRGSRGGKDGKDVKERIDPTKLPTNPVTLLQMQVAEQMELVKQSCPDIEILANRRTRRWRWRRLRSRLLRQLGFGRRTQSQRPKVPCPQKEEDEEGYKKDKPPNFQRRTWRETRSSPSQGTGLVRCNWNCDRQGHAQEFQAHTGWQQQGMVHRSLGQGEAHPHMGRAYQLLLPVLFYPGVIPHPSS